MQWDWALMTKKPLILSYFNRKSNNNSKTSQKMPFYVQFLSKINSKWHFLLKID